MTKEALPRRALGTTGLEVTTLGLGSAPLSGFRGPVTEAEASAAIQCALAGAVNYFDTSPFYGFGRAELRIGRELRDLPRDSYVLSSKVGRWMEPMDPQNPHTGRWAGGLPFQARIDYSAEGARHSLEQSTMRLGIPRIDILYIHDVDAFSHGSQEAADQRFAEVLDGCYPYLEELRRDGKVAAIGAGINDTLMSLRFARETDVDCILLAGRYTLLDQTSLAELLPLCLERDISIVLGGPFNSGILATGLDDEPMFDYAPPSDDIIARVHKLQAICRRHGVEMAAAALQFPLAHPAVASVIPGAMNVAEMDANIRFMRQEIPAEFWRDLVRERILPEEAPLPGT